MDGKYLELEITETIAMDSTLNVIDTLLQLKNLGISISIDDFGTGYSSLSYLNKFPINSLKVDQSFMRDLDIDPDSRSIVSAITSLAHSLKLKIIVEGVETHDQLAYVSKLQCHIAQGYLFSKPVSAEEMERLLSNSTFLIDLKKLKV